MFPLPWIKFLSSVTWMRAATSFWDPGLMLPDAAKHHPSENTDSDQYICCEASSCSALTAEWNPVPHPLKALQTLTSSLSFQPYLPWWCDLSILHHSTLTSFLTMVPSPLPTLSTSGLWPMLFPSPWNLFLTSLQILSFKAQFKCNPSIEPS